MLVKEAIEFGKVSKGNSKMPGTSYAIDAFACKTGSKLAMVKGTPCNQCYARKLQKLRPSVDKGWKANLEKWNRARTEQWVQAMVFQIERNGTSYHRWFDSGDLQSKKMLMAIVRVARLTPQVNHWLPTQERDMLKGVELPDNLVVRLSGSKVNGIAPNGLNTSTVFDKVGEAIGHECPAPQQGGKCDQCRACWSKQVKNVAYRKH
jgi:hypothetical protein